MMNDDETVILDLQAYHYSTKDLIFDVSSLILYCIGVLFIVLKLMQGINVDMLLPWWGFVLGFILAVFSADCASGMAHFIADNFFSPDTPILGASFIHPFREHHVDPLQITKHSFAELNGNSAFLCLPILLITYFFISSEPTYFEMCLGFYILLFTFLIVMTNKIHFWAHCAKPPKIVVWMQNCFLLLPRQMHARHHRPPFHVSYCITIGWLNPICDFFGLFTGIKRTARFLQRCFAKNLSKLD